MSLVIVIQGILLKSLLSGIALNFFSNYEDESSHGKVVKFRTELKLCNILRQ